MWLVVATLWAMNAHAADDKPIYQYTSDQGRTVLVDDIAKVPAKYMSQIKSLAHSKLPDVVRYITEDGRAAYTDEWARVPKSRRDQAAVVDLAAIPLNAELADDLRDAIEITYGKLLATDYCEGARNAAAVGWWLRLWDEYGHLLALAAILVLLFALTPIVRRHVDAAVWGKVLKTAIPLLGFVALFSFSAVKTSKMQRALVEAADPCQDNMQPGDARGKAQRIVALRPWLERIYGDHEAAIDEAMQAQ